MKSLQSIKKKKQYCSMKGLTILLESFLKVNKMYGSRIFHIKLHCLMGENK